MSNQDTIFIEKLKIETKIGVEPWEQKTLQPIELDLKLATNILPAAQNDDLNKTLNYQTLQDQLISFVKANEYLLIESLAENISNFILNNFPVTKLQLTLHKPTALTHAKNVGVMIERSK